MIGRYFGEAHGVVTVRGRLAGTPWEQEVEVHLSEANPEHAALVTVWARERIAELLLQGSKKADPEVVRRQVTELAIEYRLMSPFTSFVTVDYSEVVEPAAAAATFEQPHAGDAGPDAATRYTAEVAFAGYGIRRVSGLAVIPRTQHAHRVQLASEISEKVVVDGDPLEYRHVRLLDPELAVPRRDEWTAGFEREIGIETRLSLRYVARKLDRQYRVRDLNIGANGTRIDPGAGAVYLLDTSGKDEYDGVTLEIVRRQHGWSWAGAGDRRRRCAALGGSTRWE